MTIRVEIPFDALSQPAVAKALANLMVSLGTDGDLPNGGRRSRSKVRGGNSPPATAEQDLRGRRRGATATDLSGLPPAERWQRYVEGRPAATIRFLELLESRGTLTVDDAVRELGLSSPKAMGGMTGAMARWAPKQGVELPFEARTDAGGTRYWVWRGF